MQSTLNKFGIGEDEKVVLLVGRMDPIKSQDIAIKAIKKLDAKLVLAGNGSFTSKTLGHDKASVWVKKLRDLTQETGVKDKVIFTGYVTEKELASLYMRSDVVILTSRTEGFGLTVCEAWNYQKPVVVSKGAGVSELVIEGVNGYTFPSDSYDELAEAIRRTFKEGDKLGSMGRETLRQCSLEYAVDKIKEAMEEAMKGYPKRETD
jgi:glycosyltransferase involved in cell wall biosynthesis